MGQVKKLLFSKLLDKARPFYYSGKRSIEAAESMHVHERNVRLEYSALEFRRFVAAMKRSFEKWSGAPPEPTDATVWLDVSDIPHEPEVTPQRFDIEESTYPTLKQTTVHLHYRSLRMEFSHAEWEEFSSGIIDARKVWDNGD